MIALLFALAQTNALSPGQRLAPGQKLMLGNGFLSCAAAFRPENQRETIGWIDGYWTGMNTRNPRQVGVQTDADGIEGEVRALCQREPSTYLADATYQVYLRLEAQRR